jgi:hypothetical protein
MFEHDDASKSDQNRFTEDPPGLVAQFILDLQAGDDSTAKNISLKTFGQMSPTERANHLKKYTHITDPVHLDALQYCDGPRIHAALTRDLGRTIHSMDAGGSATIMQKGVGP